MVKSAGKAGANGLALRAAPPAPSSARLSTRALPFETPSIDLAPHGQQGPRIVDDDGLKRVLERIPAAPGTLAAGARPVEANPTGCRGLILRDH
jgi:hypothetical protein